MVDVDITKLITASGGKIWDEFSEYLREKSLIAQGEQKRELEQQSSDAKALKHAVAAAEEDIAKYRSRRLARLRIKHGGES